MRKSFKYLFIILALLEWNCTTKKNTFVTRNYHNLTAHYNPYFYARESLKEGIATIEDNHIDRYDVLLPLFVYGDAKEALAAVQMMDKTYTKASYTIERHSISIKGVEYNKWVKHAYFLIGKSHFYKHDYFAGLEVFEYLAKEYKNDPIRYDSYLWMIRTYNETGSKEKAQGMIDLMNDDKKFPKKLSGEFAAISADFYARQEDWTLAVKFLTKAISETKKKKQKQRYTYVLAQYYQKMGQNKKAAKIYTEVLKLNPPFEMAFNAKINIAKTYDEKSKGSRDVKKNLLKMLKETKYIDFHDQVYFALAEIAEKEKDQKQEEKYLRKCIEVSKQNKQQKGLAAAKLGDMYFEMTKYESAEAYYDTAVSNLNPDYEFLYLVKNKKENLTKLVENIKIIAREDSLQGMAKMSPKDREKYIEKSIEKAIAAEERRLDEIEKQKQQAEFDKMNGNKSSSGADAGGSSGSTWYFYNSNSMTFGATEFAKKWGIRKLEDNWRRSNKQSLSSNPDDANAKDSLKSNTSSAKASKVPSKEQVLKSIPDSPEKLAASDKLIIEAFYTLGVIYKEQLENEEKAAEAYEELLVRYPENNHKLQCYYQLYRLYLSMEEEKKAEKYKNLLLTKYPDSEYSQIIKDPNYNKKKELSRNQTERYYEETYEFYEKNNCSEVTSRCAFADTMSAKSPLKPKFDMLRALCVGKTSDINSFEMALKKIVAVYPTDPVSKQAAEILVVIAARKGQVSENKTPIDTAKALYTFSEGEQYVVLIMSTVKTPVAEQKSAFSAFNTTYFSRVTLNVTDLVFDDKKQMITVKGFNELLKAMEYFQALKTDTDVFKKLDKGTFDYFVISPANYLNFYKDKRIGTYSEFFEKEYLKK